MMQKALIAAGLGLSMSATFVYGVHPIFIVLSFLSIVLGGKIGAEIYYKQQDKKALPPAQPKKALPALPSIEEDVAAWKELRALERTSAMERTLARQRKQQELADTWDILGKMEEENDRLDIQRHAESTSERFLKSRIDLKTNIIKELEDENSKLKKRMEERGEIIKVLESANDRWQRRVRYLESSDHHTWPPEYDE